MKKAIKKIIKNENLQDKLRLIYNSIRTINPKLLIEEIKFRKNGLPDNFPFPNSKLIFTIIAIPWVSEYYKSGKLIFDDMIFQLKKANVNLSSNANILDFGCGCGRLIRHFASENKFHLFGSDLNSELINWCNKNLTFGKFQTNKISPPLNYDDNFFDLIYARSVFTHLSEELQFKWIAEIKRILKPGGVFYFTTHGKKTIHNLTNEERNKFFNDEIVLHNYFDEGDNKFSTYQSFGWTTKNLLNDFSLLLFEEGKDLPHLAQDIYVIMKK